MEFLQRLDISLQQNQHVWHEISPVVHAIPGGVEFLDKIIHHVASQPLGETLVAVGGPPGAGKETFIGQIIAQLLDMQAHPEGYEVKLPDNLEIKHLSYAEALREARKRGLISSQPGTTPKDERIIVSEFISDQIHAFYHDHPDHPKLLFYEAVMVTYPEEDIGALPLLKQQTIINQGIMDTTSTETMENMLQPRKVFAAFLAPELELVEEINFSARTELKYAATDEEVRSIFEIRGTHFEGDITGPDTIDILNTSWASPNKYRDIIATIKRRIVQQKENFQRVLSGEDDEIRTFLERIKQPLTPDQLDELFSENPDYFIYAQLALYFIFAIGEAEMMPENIFIGINRRLNTSEEHMNPYYRRLIKNHALSLELAKQ